MTSRISRSLRTILLCSVVGLSTAAAPPAPRLTLARLSPSFLLATNGIATRALTVTLRGEGGAYLAVVIPEVTWSQQRQEGRTVTFTFRSLPAGTWAVVGLLLDQREQIVASRPIGIVNIVE